MDGKLSDETYDKYLGITLKMIEAIVPTKETDRQVGIALQYRNLILAIMIHGINEVDEKWLHSNDLYYGSFVFCCDTMGLCHKRLRKEICKIMEIKKLLAFS